MMKFLLIAGFAESLLGFRGALIAALQSRGLELHVAAPGLQPGLEFRRELEQLSITVHDIPLQRTGANPLSDLRALLALVALMRRIRPDWVLGYTVKPVIYGSLAAWLARVPHRYALITGLGYVFQEHERRGRLQALVRRLYRLALGRAHKVFFQNPDDELLFRRCAILKAATPSCVVNGSGVDVARFSAAAVPPGPPRFLLIARLLGDKGVREYAQAARRVRIRHPDVQFAIAGWIDTNPDAIEKAELEAWVADGTLSYLGRLSDVRPAIAACSVYVLPSYREGTPRTVLEAMSRGRPVITTDAPGCRETVVHGDNGFLVPVRSVEALEHAMNRFVADHALITRMGRRAREIAEEKYDVHKVNEVMLREMGIA
ncbi:N, N'-diacetylbacillosaminyl-diphospho-undecaprenol alpha-1,3-N-acetylgalactosaminyltransferase [Variovorax sp. PBS-H4]|uniref:glycosyltransferase family 4 protein n=1 Tax=Variovorax sp. PBS-H4 TaxID=434008 RepID=UPI0013199114|nr:glycosyltransferase family 4 protein [Variovorax sp. PBS-H4]VTU40967.1 N, N'-diacetylbacillosaminyl-diphospho-undecaprenol alpha-1,3-N-acetylgalactosaminyltransferase [Variovorax sp. PBS-H4]